MAATFGELKTAVKTTLARFDLDAVIPGFCNNAIARINQELARSGGIIDQEQMAYASTVAGQDTLLLPDDFDALQFIKIGTDTLEQTTPDQLIEAYGDATGTPEKYALFAKALLFRPIPDAVVTVNIGYLMRYQPFYEDPDNNYLLTQGGNLMLYGACLEAAPMLRDDPRLAVWGASFKEALRLFIEANARTKRGPKQNAPQFDPALLAIGSGGRTSILNG